MNPLLTIPAAAALLSLSPATLRRRSASLRSRPRLTFRPWMVANHPGRLRRCQIDGFRGILAPFFLGVKDINAAEAAIAKATKAGGMVPGMGASVNPASRET